MGGFLIPIAAFQIGKFAPFAVATFLLVYGLAVVIQSRRIGTIADIARIAKPK